jgi:hypothetical protein
MFQEALSTVELAGAEDRGSGRSDLPELLRTVLGNGWTLEPAGCSVGSLSSQERTGGKNHELRTITEIGNLGTQNDPQDSLRENV